MNSLSLRRLVLGLAALTILGCSGLSSLVVVNKTGGKISVTAKAEAENVPKEGNTVTVEPNSEHDILSWMADPPPKLEVQAKLADGKILNAVWPSRSYPPAMREGTSAGALFFVDVSEDKLALRDPTAWDNFRRNPQYTIFPILIILCPVGTIALIVVLMIRGRRTPPPEIPSK